VEPVTRALFDVYAPPSVRIVLRHGNVLPGKKARPPPRLDVGGALKDVILVASRPAWRFPRYLLIWKDRWKSAMVKHAFMLTLWRFQQTQAILGLVLWGILLTTTSFPIVWPLMSNYLESWFGIQASEPGAVLFGLTILFAFIVSVLFVFGLIYDKYLRLWREQADVAIDRNPYTRERLTAKEILTWRHMFLPALRAVSSAKGANAPNPGNEGPEKEHIEFMEQWIAESLENPRIRRAVEETETQIQPRP